MRYYRALQRNGTGRWDYTVTDSMGIMPVGYCSGEFDTLFPELKEGDGVPVGFLGVADYMAYRAKKLPYRNMYHFDGHASLAGACACYREYLLDTAIDFRLKGRANGHFPCEAPGCKELTQTAVMYAGYHHYWLCDAHKTRQSVAYLAPQVEEIWSS